MISSLIIKSAEMLEIYSIAFNLTFYVDL